MAATQNPSVRGEQTHGDVLTPEQVGAAVTSFALLADPTRVRMLWALREAELNVATLAGVADCRPTVASQHLSKLRLAGLVEGTRDSRRIVYRLRGGHIRRRC
jgi:DNA-binding transcriptional ArsR family regulator